MSKFERNWQQLADIARSETNLIPVVGSGLNIQARQQADSWTQLLHEVADNFQLSEKDLQAVDQQSYGMTAVWERFVTALAEREDVALFCVGVELSRTAIEREADWRHLIAGFASAIPARSCTPPTGGENTTVSDSGTPSTTSVSTPSSRWVSALTPLWPNCAPAPR